MLGDKYSHRFYESDFFYVGFLFAGDVARRLLQSLRRRGEGTQGRGHQVLQQPRGGPFRPRALRRLPEALSELQGRLRRRPHTLQRTEIARSDISPSFRVVRGGDRQPSQRDRPASAGVHGGRIPGPRGGPRLLLDRAHGNGLRRRLRLGRAANEREFHTAALRTVRGGERNEATDEQVLEPVHRLHEVGKEGRVERRRHNRVININDTGLDLEKAIRDNIKLHCDDNLYANYQSRHKKLELSLYASVEETYATKEGRYSPEVIVTSPHSSVCNKHSIHGFMVYSTITISRSDHHSLIHNTP